MIFGNPEVTPGGRALKFYSSVRLDIRKGEQIKGADQVLGNKTKIKIVKNKVAPPFKTIEVDIMYGQGISYEGELLDIGSEINVVEKAGAWYSYNGEKIGQGKENAKIFLKEHPEVSSKIEKQIREHYKIGGKLEEEKKNKKKEKDK